MVDIRPATDDLTLDTVIDIAISELVQRGVITEVVSRTHNQGIRYTDPGRLEKYMQIVREVTGFDEVQLDFPGDSRYIDMQMIWDAVGRPDVFMFGGGIGFTAHKADGHIAISSRIKTREFFCRILLQEQATG